MVAIAQVIHAVSAGPEDVEPAPVFQAADRMSRDVPQSEGHKAVLGVRNDGILNHHTVMIDDDVPEIAGTGLDHPKHSPTRKAFIVGALEQMDEVENREAFLDVALPAPAAKASVAKSWRDIIDVDQREGTA